MKPQVSVSVTPTRATIKIPMRTKNSTNAREHWAVRKKRAAEQRGIAMQSCMFALRRFRGITPLFVRLTRIAPRMLDEGTEMDALKHVRDGVADALGITDTGRDGVAWMGAQERGAVREYAVKIDVWTEG